MMRNFLLVLLLCLASNAESAEITSKPFNSNLAKWYSTTPNADNSSEIFFEKANRSDIDWKVLQRNSYEVIAKLYDDRLPHKTPVSFDTTIQLPHKVKSLPVEMIKVDDGWIAGYNEGEWGGALYWYSSDGKKKQRLADCCYSNLVQDGSRFFIAEGVAHMSYGSGSILELKKVNGSWKVETFLDFFESIEGITCISPGNFAIISSSSICRFNLDKEITILARYPGWAYLYPNSITHDGEFIYVGMRQYIVKCPISNSSQAAQFLAPDKDWINQDSDTQLKTSYPEDQFAGETEDPFASDD